MHLRLSAVPRPAEPAQRIPDAADRARPGHPGPDIRRHLRRHRPFHRLSLVAAELPCRGPFPRPAGTFPAGCRRVPGGAGGGGGRAQRADRGRHACAALHGHPGNDVTVPGRRAFLRAADHRRHPEILPLDFRRHGCGNPFQHHPVPGCHCRLRIPAAVQPAGQAHPRGGLGPECLTALRHSGETRALSCVPALRHPGGDCGHVHDGAIRRRRPQGRGRLRAGFNHRRGHWRGQPGGRGRAASWAHSPGCSSSGSSTTS